jgi:hypothetical protein
MLGVNNRALRVGERVIRLGRGKWNTPSLTSFPLSSPKKFQKKKEKGGNGG